MAAGNIAFCYTLGLNLLKGITFKYYLKDMQPFKINLSKKRLFTFGSLMWLISGVYTLMGFKIA